MTKPNDKNTDANETVEPKPAITVAGIQITKAGKKQQRMSVLLWGASGCGKTTLACTMPGRKLLVLFDPDGDVSVAGRDDVDVLDLSSANKNIVEKFKSEDPFSLSKVLDNYDTIIFDSLSNAQHLTIMHAVTLLKGATIERPSLAGYGHRNALITQLVKNALRITGKHNKHVAFIAHEAAPDRSEDGVVLSVTLALGGQLVTTAPVDFSEVWCVQDTGKQRRILIRPARAYKPCKTRMFKTNGLSEFPWKHTGTEMADWFAAWEAGGNQKLDLPK